MSEPVASRQGDLAAREVLRLVARKWRARSGAGSSDREVAALSDIRRQAWRTPLRVMLGSAAATVGAFWLITTYPKNSAAALLTVEITGMMAGPPMFVVGIVWMFKVVRRRRQVQVRHWVAYPARSAVMRYGPLRRTVVGLEITPTATLVIYPEEWFRSRVRRLVEQEGELLVLLPRPDKVLAPFLYAGPSGSPVFAENRALAADPQRFGERRGLVALARRIAPS